MPPGEQMFKFHGHSCPCPRPSLKVGVPPEPVPPKAPPEDVLDHSPFPYRRLEALLERCKSFISQLPAGLNSQMVAEAQELKLQIDRHLR